MRVALSAGHHPAAPGACTGVLSEYGLTSEIIGRLVNLLSKRGHDVWLIGSDTNARQVTRINELGCDCGLELHFNSFSDSDMKGTETLHAGSKNGIVLANCIQQSLVDALQTKDRGIKVGHFRGDDKNRVIEIIRETRCPFVVPEPLFLSNPADLSKLDTALIAGALLKGLENYEIYTHG